MKKATKTQAVELLTPRPIKTAPKDKPHFRGLMVYDIRTGKSRWVWYFGRLNKAGYFALIDDGSTPWAICDYEFWMPAPNMKNLPPQ